MKKINIYFFISLLFVTAILCFYSLSWVETGANSTSASTSSLPFYEQIRLLNESRMKEKEASQSSDAQDERSEEYITYSSQEATLSDGENTENVSGEEELENEENVFELKSLIVDGTVEYNYGATQDISGFLDYHVLVYETEEETEYAYYCLLGEGKNVIINKVVQATEVTTDYAQENYDYSGYNSWGAEAMEVGGIRQYIDDNNLDNEVVVVVMDTGINTSHEMFEERLLKEDGNIQGYAVVKSTISGTYKFEDDHGHGSHVAGIVCDLTPSNVKIFPIKIGDRFGQSEIDLILAGYDYVYNTLSAKYTIACINLSFGGFQACGDAFDKLYEKNILCCVSAGNDAEGIYVENFVASIDEEKVKKAIVVSSLKVFGGFGEDSASNAYDVGFGYCFDSSYSNFGDLIDFCAPGSSILSAYKISKTAYMIASGTSMASPSVAGVIALLKLVNPSMTASQLEEELQKNCFDLGEEGKDDYYGYGMPYLRYFQADKDEGVTLSFRANFEDKKSLEIKNEYWENGVYYFTKSFELEITCSDPNYEIYYTDEREIPTCNMNKYGVESIKVGYKTTNYEFGADIRIIAIKKVDGKIKKFTDICVVSFFPNYSDDEMRENITDFLVFDTISGTTNYKIVGYTGKFKKIELPEYIDGHKIVSIGYKYSAEEIEASDYEFSNEYGLFNNKCTQYITIPKTITEIGNYAFYYSKSIYYFYAPGVTSIGDHCFEQCNTIRYLTSDITKRDEGNVVLLSSLTSLGEKAFFDCEKLEDVYLDKLENIGAYCFANNINYCENRALEKCVLPNINSIPAGLFDGCIYLDEFEIGQYVETISAENQYRSLASHNFTMDSRNKFFYNDGNGIYGKDGALKLFSQKNKIDDYVVKSVVNIDGTNYPITKIEEHVWSLYYKVNSDGRVKLNSLTIPYSIREMSRNSLNFYCNTFIYAARNVENMPDYDLGYSYLLASNLGRADLIITGNVEKIPRIFYGLGSFPTDIYFNSASFDLENNLGEEAFFSDRQYINEYLNFYFENELGDYTNIFENLNSKFNITNKYGKSLIINKINSCQSLDSLDLKSSDAYPYYLKTTDYIDQSRYLHNEERYIVSNKPVIYIASNLKGAISTKKDIAVDVGSNYWVEFDSTPTNPIKDIKIDGNSISSSALATAQANKSYTFVNVTACHTIELLYTNPTSAIADEYTVSFYNNGDLIYSYKTNYNNTPHYDNLIYGIPTNRDGVTYLGWKDKNNQEINLSTQKITEDTVYEAFFSGSDLSYNVIFKNNGSVLQQSLVESGNHPTYNNATPTKNSSEPAKYEYEFLGWKIEGTADNEIVDLTTEIIVCDTVYEAVFKEKYKEYTISFKNHDNSPLREYSLKYDEIPIYSGPIPEKESTIAKTYEFSGWSPNITPVTKNATYTAQFTESTRQYFIYFENDGGGRLHYDLFDYGATPSYLDGTIPEKISYDANYYYEFKNWKYYDEDNLEWKTGFHTVNGTETYIAVYEEKERDATQTYTITVTSTGNGYVSPSGEVSVNQGNKQWFYFHANTGSQVLKITVDGIDLNEDDLIGAINGGFGFLDITNNHTISVLFSGDTPSITTYTITATAGSNGTISPSGSVSVDQGENKKFTFTPNTGYKVSSIIIDGVALTGSNLSNAINNGYTFSNVGSNHTIAVQFAKNTYTIVFKNYDGTILQSNSVEYGVTPSYSGTTPTKSSDAQYSYTFSGWTPTIVAVTGDATYTATFSSVARKYIITFKNYDNTTLQSNNVEYGVTPSYSGTTPTKSSDAQYSYTFSGWTPTIVAVTGDATYTATFSSATRKYTIIFKNYDEEDDPFDNDDILETKENVEYGTVITFVGTPTKTSTAKYVYTFSNWNAEFTSVTEDATYIAYYSKQLREYTIVFKNEDGSTLQTNEVGYGVMPSFGGDEPTKTSTAQYEYTFSGWTPTIVAVTGEATYTATFSSVTRKYTITFENYDGTTLQTSEVGYGATPSYSGATPTRSSDAQYNYTFSGWDPTIVAVTGEATYTATFGSVIRKYNITFKNDTGNIISQDDYEYGCKINKVPDDQTKEKTVQYEYYFDGWQIEKTSNIKTKEELLNFTVEGEVTFIAHFNKITRKYKITLYYLDNGVETSSEIECEYLTSKNDLSNMIGSEIGNPSKKNTAEHTYVFVGWSEGSSLVIEYEKAWASGFKDGLKTVKGDAIYVATFMEKLATYTITFNYLLNDVESSLSFSDLESGTTVEELKGLINGHIGGSPTKRDDDTYSYSFVGWSCGTTEYEKAWVDDWSEEIAIVSGDATYVATFKATKKEYTVIFKDGNGNKIETGKDTYTFGEELTVPTEASKDSDNYWVYTFNGSWKPEVGSPEYDGTCKGNATYVAQFSKEIRYYSVVFKNDATILKGENSTYVLQYNAVPEYDGADPTMTSIYPYDYTWSFVGWKIDGEGALITDLSTQKITKDTTYEATFLENYYVNFYYNEYTTKTNYTQKCLHSEQILNGEKSTYTGKPETYSTSYATYEFKWWKKVGTNDDEQIDLSSYPITSKTDFIAVFSVTDKQYTVTFKDGNGNKIETGKDTYTFGEELTVPTEASKNSDEKYDYTFNGSWEPEVGDGTCKGDATYIAKFNSSLRRFTVKFSDSGNEVKTIEVEYEKSVSEAELFMPDKIAEKNVYKFKYWADSSDKQANFEKIKSNLEVHSIYTEFKRIFSVKFETYCDTKIDDVEYSFGDDKSLISLNDDCKTGYVFLGWTKTNNQNDTNYIKKISKNDCQDFILYAQWKEKDTVTPKYTILYYFENLSNFNFSLDDSKTEEFETTVDENIEITTAKKFDNYTFDESNINNKLEGTVSSDEKLVLKLYYKLKRFNVALSTDNNGKITSLFSEVKYGADIDFKITSNEGYKIKQVTVSNGIENVLNGNILSLKNVTKDTSIEVTFEPIKSIVKVIIDGEATATCDDTLTDIGYKKDREINFSVSEGWNIEYAYLDGKYIEIKNNKICLKEIKQDTVIYLICKEEETMPLGLTINDIIIISVGVFISFVSFFAQRKILRKYKK